MIQKVITWKKAYTRKVREADMAKMERDRKSKITPEDVIEFESSSLVRNTIKLLGQMLNGKNYEITQRRYSDVKGFIITQVFINNGHRVRVLANMNLQEFKDAEEKNNRYTITVFKHKEARSGPIRIKMDAKLYSWMKLFINKFRPVVTQDTSPTSKGFLTWNGKPFKKSGGISSASDAFWRRSGVKRSLWR